MSYTIPEDDLVISLCQRPEAGNIVFFILFLMRSCTTTLKPHKPGLGLPPSLEEPYEAEAPRTVLKPSLSSNGA